MKRLSSMSSLYLALAALLLSLLSAGAPNNTIQAQRKSSPDAKCPRPDKEVENDIREKLKAAPKLKDQMDHIYVIVKDGAVILRGWVSGGRAEKRQVVALASSVTCVKKPIDAKDLSIEKPPSELPKSGCDKYTETTCSNGSCVPKGQKCG